MLPREQPDRIHIALDDRRLVANAGLILPVTLARAWGAGAGPGDDPLTIDLDSTVCGICGLTKEGARRHKYADQRGYHALLAAAEGTGDGLPDHLSREPTAASTPTPSSPSAAR